MNQKQIDKDVISKLSPIRLRMELYAAITAIRKVTADLPESKRRTEKNYNKGGHMRCVNYLKGFMNQWRDSHGS